jgi:cytochrome c oxidase subunit II
MQFPSLINAAYGATLPIAATDSALRWDSLYNFLLALSLLFCVLVIGAMVLFAIQYRHRAGVKPVYITGSHALESLFVVIPTILLLVIFGWGYSVYHEMMTPPSDAYEVHVIGKQWLWQFQYDNGQTTIGKLYVPLNKPVKLIMTSQDVLHDFFIPNFRVKSDVVPGMYTSVWFEAHIPGEHQVFCSQYCGTSHSGMLAKVVVLDDAQWKDFQRGKKIGTLPDARDIVAGLDGDSKSLADRVSASQAAATLEPVSLVSQGKVVFETKGCVSCHSVDGSAKIGPSSKGLYGHKVQLADGRKLMRDENYFRSKIEDPQAQLLMGYKQSVMPTFKGLISETEMNALIAYIKSLK